jgi:hypothetical protein
MSNKEIILPAVLIGIIGLSVFFLGGSIIADKNKPTDNQRVSDVSDSLSSSRDSIASSVASDASDYMPPNFYQRVSMGGKRTKKRRRHRKRKTKSHHRK